MISNTSQTHGEGSGENIYIGNHSFINVVQLRINIRTIDELCLLPSSNMSVKGYYYYLVVTHQEKIKPFMAGTTLQN